MKKVLMVLSISLFLFSCGETIKSEKTENVEVKNTQNVEDQIVGSWKLKSIAGAEVEGTMTINNDKTGLINGSPIKWSIKDNKFCREVLDENIPKGLRNEECSTVKINGGELSLTAGDDYKIEMIYEKVN